MLKKKKKDRQKLGQGISKDTCHLTENLGSNQNVHFQWTWQLP